MKVALNSTRGHSPLVMCRCLLFCSLCSDTAAAPVTRCSLDARARHADVRSRFSLVSSVSLIKEQRKKMTERQRLLEIISVAICRRPSVYRLSVVCNVRAPYLGDSNFRQCFYVIGYLGHPLTSRQNFTEIVTGEPNRWGVKHKRGGRI